MKEQELELIEVLKAHIKTGRAILKNPLENWELFVVHDNLFLRKCEACGGITTSWLAMYKHKETGQHCRICLKCSDHIQYGYAEDLIESYKIASINPDKALSISALDYCLKAGVISEALGKMYMEKRYPVCGISPIDRQRAINSVFVELFRKRKPEIDIMTMEYR